MGGLGHNGNEGTDARAVRRACRGERKAKRASRGMVLRGHLSNLLRPLANLLQGLTRQEQKQDPQVGSCAS
jgi:hypothetical protein